GPSSSGRSGRGGGRKGYDNEPTDGMTLGLDIGIPVGIAILAVFLSWVLANSYPQLGYAIPLFVACLFMSRPLRFGLGMGVVLLLIDLHGGGGRQALLTERSYFGILHVRRGADSYIDEGG